MIDRDRANRRQARWGGRANVSSLAWTLTHRSKALRGRNLTPTDLDVGPGHTSLFRTFPACTEPHPKHDLPSDA